MYNIPASMYNTMVNPLKIVPNIQQDHQTLLKAKYCPRVAATLRTRKNTKAPCDLDL